MTSPISLWRIPSTEGLDLDSAQAINVHREIIERKPFLKNLYQDFYAEFIAQAQTLRPLKGDLLELGSGGGFLKSLIPEVITSDVCENVPSLDAVVFADHLPFKDQALKGIFFLNVLHHLTDPEAFFREADRTLVPGGKIVMIEPFNSAWARLLYKNFHEEPFDETVTQWHTEGRGRLSTSNQALGWIIFHRDRARFESLFPNLRIETLKPHTVLRYPLSGGMTYRGFCPAFFYPVTRWVDHVLSYSTSLFPIFETIVLQKR